MSLIISQKIRAKLANKTPPVTEDEITQCFTTRSGVYLRDLREEHQTDPPTRWFISETYYGRMLKIVFIRKDNDVIIKTAYDPNANEARIYKKYGIKQVSQE